jgi:quinol monooxygenase YgiN
MKSKKIITYVVLDINPALIEEVLSEAKVTREKIVLEEGCEAFIMTSKKQSENTLAIFAIYVSQQSYEWHQEQDYVKSFFNFLNGKLENAPVVTYLEEI